MIFKLSSESLKHQASIIFSPQTSSSASPPQILNQDLISGLFSVRHQQHLPPIALEHWSHPGSRKGDKEDNSESDTFPERLRAAICITDFPRLALYELSLV